MTCTKLPTKELGNLMHILTLYAKFYILSTKKCYKTKDYYNIKSTLHVRKIKDNNDFKERNFK